MNPEETQSSVPQEDRPQIRPNLRAQESLSSNPTSGRSWSASNSTGIGGGGASSSTGSASSKAASAATGGLYNPSGDNTGDTKASLAGAEAKPGAGSDNSLYNPSESANRRQKFKQLVAQNRKKVLLGGGATAGIISIIIGGIFLLVPLKLEHMVENLQKRFFAGSQQAVQDETDKAFKKYVTRYVLPGYERCGTTVSKSCKAKTVANTTNPVTTTYKAWADNKIETKLAENYGIEFKREGGSWYIKAPGTSTKGVNIGADGSGLDREFNRADRSAMRAAVNDALANETLWKKIHMRYKVGRLLEEKYGITRCIIFCGTQDKFADKRDERKNAARLLIIQRVVIPRTESLGVVMLCIYNDSCGNVEETQPTTAESGTNGELAGAPENAATDTAIRAKLEELAGSRLSSETIDKMLADYKTISEKGYQAYVIDKVLEKLGLSALSDKVASATPVVGWIKSTSQIIDAAHNLGPNVKKLRYVVNSGAAVSAFMLYRTYADEVHTGHVNSAEVGSLVNSLGPGNRGASSDSELGGTASAESTPLYKSIVNDGQTTYSGSIFSSLLPATFADSTSDYASSDYKCKDGNSVPKGQLVCDEEVLGGGSAAASSVSSLLSLPGISIISGAAHIVNSILSPIVNLFGDLFSKLPGVSNVSDLISKAIEPIFKTLTSVIIPSPVGSNMSGGRTFDVMAAGANVAGNDACDQVGCKTVDTKTAAAILDQQYNDERRSFNNKSYFARMFDTSSSYSMVSRLAMATPTNAASLETGFADLLRNPFGSLGHGFGALLSGPAASAATNANSVDPFKTGSKAFPTNEIPSDPEAYWDANCSDNPSYAYRKDNSWNEEATHHTDPNTGMPIHDTSNACLLIKQMTGDAGGKYNSGLLTDDEQTITNNGQAADTSSTADSRLDMEHLYDDSTSVQCADQTRDLGVQDGYHDGNKIKIRVCAIPNLPCSGGECNDEFGISGANGQAVINSRASGAVYAMVAAAKKDGVQLTASSTFRTMAHQTCLYNHTCGTALAAVPGTSNHQMGLAIDFNVPQCSTTIQGQCSDPGNPMWDWLYKNASDFGYKSAVASEAWHWSPTGN